MTIKDRRPGELSVRVPIGRGKSAGARLVQEYLTLNGVRLVIDGDWGDATSKALAMFIPGATVVDQRVMDLLARKLLRMIEPNAPGPTLAKAIMQTAHQHLDVHPVEIGGENAGPYVRLYMDGMQGKGAPWCMGFVSWVIRQAAEALGISAPAHLARTYSCDVAGARARVAEKLVAGTDKRAEAAALFLVRGKKPGDWIHTGIIVSHDEKTFTTIEGNTNDNGSREGFEVCLRIRARSAVDAVLL